MPESGALGRQRASRCRLRCLRSMLCSRFSSAFLKTLRLLLGHVRKLEMYIRYHQGKACMH